MLRLDGQDVPWLVGVIVVVLINRLIFPDSLGCFSSIGVRFFSAHLPYASRACHFHPAAIIMIYQEGVILPFLYGVAMPLGLHVLFDIVFVISA